MNLAALDVVARWLHILAVVVWIGHNYVNVVQNPEYKRLRPSATPSVDALFMAALKREHGVFRHASLVVLLTGIYMLWFRGILADAILLSGHHAVIGLGVWLGTLMVLNLWFILWPHQKKVLGFTPASVEERIRCSRITFLSSRTNTILSFPAVFFMVAGAHGAFLF